MSWSCVLACFHTLCVFYILSACFTLQIHLMNSQVQKEVAMKLEHKRPQSHNTYNTTLPTATLRWWRRHQWPMKMSPCSMPFSSDIIYSNSVWLPDVNNETYYAVPSHVPVLYKCVMLQHFPDYIMLLLLPFWMWKTVNHIRMKMLYYNMNMYKHCLHVHMHNIIFHY